MSKRCHHLMKRLGGKPRAAGNLGAFVQTTYMGPLEEARGEAVGPLVSKYTAAVSSPTPGDAAFDAAVGAALGDARANPSWGAGRDSQDAPSRDEVEAAVGALASRLHKSPGRDRVYKWMLVWGGDLQPWWSTPSLTSSMWSGTQGPSLRPGRRLRSPTSTKGVVGPQRWPT